MLQRRLEGIVDNNIQVSGTYDFAEKELKKALIFFLQGLWQNEPEIISRAKIILGTVTLRLDWDSQEYFAYGNSHEVLPDPLPFLENERLAVGPQKNEVEQGLLRFAEEDQIKQITIILQNGLMQLWKKETGGYSCFAEGIPITWMNLAPLAINDPALNLQ